MNEWMNEWMLYGEGIAVNSDGRTKYINTPFEWSADFWDVEVSISCRFGLKS